MREEFKIATGCAALATLTGLASVAFAINGNLAEALGSAGAAAYAVGSAYYNTARGLTETIRETREAAPQEAPQQTRQP